MDIFRIANKLEDAQDPKHAQNLKEPQTIIQQKEGWQNTEQVSQRQKGKWIEEKRKLPLFQFIIGRYKPKDIVNNKNNR